MTASSTEKLEIYLTTVDRVTRRRGLHSVPQWRWRYRATNGKVLAQSSEGYHDRSDCIKRALQVVGLALSGTSSVAYYRGAVVYAFWYREGSMYPLELVDRAGVRP